MLFEYAADVRVTYVNQFGRFLFTENLQPGFLVLCASPSGITGSNVFKWDADKSRKFLVDE